MARNSLSRGGSPGHSGGTFAADVPGLRTAFWLMLTVAVVLRFYHLDTPSMWLDEILVPMAARHPVSYIFDLVTTAEVHPPTYYLLVKLLLECGVSDFALRVVPAAFGVASVAALFAVVRRHISPAAALYAMAFLAASPLHLYISRVVRMYSILIFLLIAAMGCLLAYARSGSRADLYRLIGLNIAMTSLHYVGFMILAAQCAAFLWVAPRVGGRRPWRDIALYAAGSAVAVGLVLPFFVSRLLRTHKGQFMGYSYLEALGNIGGKIGQVLWLFPNWPVQVLVAVPVAAGLVLAFRLRTPAGRAFACLGLLPLFFLAATKYDYYAFNVWHLSFLLVPVSVYAGLAAGRWVPAVSPALGALLLTGGLGAFLLGPRFSDFYAADTAILPFFTLSKPLARNLPPLLGPDGAVVFCDVCTLNGYFWYADQFGSGDRLRRQTVTPDQTTRTVRFVSGSGSFGAYAKTEEGFLARYGRPASVEKTFQAAVYRFEVPKTPLPAIGTLPYAAGTDADLLRFYATVDSAWGLTLDTNWGGAAGPADTGEAGFEYVVENTAPGPQLLVLHQEFVNSGRGNRYVVRYRFDDEPFVEAARIDGPSQDVDLGFVVERRTPYARLTVRVEMLLAPYTADFAGGNQSTLGFRRMDLRVTPLTEAGTPGGAQKTEAGS
ncbi:glycosyltransferase family 39 protein [Solidesulfovibrio sp.]